MREHRLFERARARRPQQLDQAPDEWMLVEYDNRRCDPYNTADRFGLFATRDGACEFERDGRVWQGDRRPTVTPPSARPRTDRRR